MSNDGRVSHDPTRPEAESTAVTEEAAASDVWERIRAGADQEDHAGPTRRSTVMAVTGLATSLLIAVLTIVPSPYAIGGPGPTYDTLATDGGASLVTITGAPTYPPSGELRLTTVSVSDAASQPFTMGAVLRAFLSGSAYTVPREAVFGATDEEAEEVAEQSRVDWVTSQERATVSALEALGTEVPAELRVAEFIEGSDAIGLLQVDDYLVALDGQRLDGFADLADGIAAREPGDEVDVTIDRGGEELYVSFVLSDNGEGEPVMGIFVDPEFDLPIQVDVAIDTVGGPSAGLMFSLGIMDLLTPEDELAGVAVAGTGTIDTTGDVGPIGGIALKMAGAARDGAAWFLAPQSNCDEVLGHIPGGLSVVAVETIDDAYAAIVAIGEGQTNALPTCSAVAG